MPREQLGKSHLPDVIDFSKQEEITFAPIVFPDLDLDNIEVAPEPRNPDAGHRVATQYDTAVDVPTPLQVPPSRYTPAVNIGSLLAAAPPVPDPGYAVPILRPQETHPKPRLRTTKPQPRRAENTRPKAKPKVSPRPQPKPVQRRVPSRSATRSPKRVSPPVPRLQSVTRASPPRRPSISPIPRLDVALSPHNVHSLVSRGIGAPTPRAMHSVALSPHERHVEASVTPRASTVSPQIPPQQVSEATATYTPPRPEIESQREEREEVVHTDAGTQVTQETEVVTAPRRVVPPRVSPPRSTRRVRYELCPRCVFHAHAQPLPPRRSPSVAPPPLTRLSMPPSVNQVSAPVQSQPEPEHEPEDDSGFMHLLEERVREKLREEAMRVRVMQRLQAMLAETPVEEEVREETAVPVEMIAAGDIPATPVVTAPRVLSHSVALSPHPQRPQPLVFRSPSPSPTPPPAVTTVSVALSPHRVPSPVRVSTPLSPPPPAATEIRVLARPEPRKAPARTEVATQMVVEEPTPYSHVTVTQLVREPRRVPRERSISPIPVALPCSSPPSAHSIGLSPICPPPLRLTPEPVPSHVSEPEQTQDVEPPLPLSVSQSLDEPSIGEVWPRYDRARAQFLVGEGLNAGPLADESTLSDETSLLAHYSDANSSILPDTYMGASHSLSLGEIPASDLHWLNR
ncbi:hypothetical protein KIPB_001129 [Kipferlia bialata]|uniref:Uncharacterized protein n=1 Tax=Kipferlia bialata TaxID=797122 RepID=A0A391NJA8_9EUKA|nr:hypothetical protein KIPB_001129 [Kipferlia bialata]|eukprot:g1129.t1